MFGGGGWRGGVWRERRTANERERRRAAAGGGAAPSPKHTTTTYVLLDHLGGDQGLHHADYLLVVDLELLGQRARVGELAGRADAREELLLDLLHRASLVAGERDHGPPALIPLDAAAAASRVVVVVSRKIDREERRAAFGRVARVFQRFLGVCVWRRARSRCLWL